MWNGLDSKLSLRKSPLDGAVICPACCCGHLTAGHDDFRSTDHLINLTRFAFVREEIAKFLATLERLPVQAASAGLVDIVSATKRTGRSIGEIFGAILAGDIPAGRVEGPVGVNMVRFKLHDLDPIRLRPPRVVQESA
jgi:hypothetical protein